MKKIVSFTLAFVMLVSILCGFGINAYAKEGSCGENATFIYNTSTGSLTISGKGAISARDYNYYPWFSYNDKVKTITIKKGITSIDNGAFFYCDNLTKVSMADTVKRIGDRAFCCTFSLKDVEISQNLESIGQEAFSLSAIKKLSIPNSVTRIDKLAFAQSNIESVFISKNVKYVSPTSFAGCESLKSISVSIKNEKYTAENGVLFNKSKDVLMTYPAGKDAKSYIIPRSVGTIGEKAFYYSKITNIDIPNSVKTISSYSFGYSKNLKTVTISNSVDKMGSYAFLNCSALKNIKLSNGIKSIPYGAFYNCSSMEKIFIPTGVERIEMYAFCDCFAIKSVAIPNTLSYIGFGAFSDDTNDEPIGDGEDDYVDENIYLLKNLEKVYYYKGAPDSIDVGDRNTAFVTAKKNVHSCHSFKYDQTCATTKADGIKTTRCYCGYYNRKVTPRIKTVALSKSRYVYDGKTKKPTVTVKDSRGNTISSKHYSVSYSAGRKEIGKYKATIKFNGDKYSGTVIKYFEIDPKGTSISSLYAQRGGVYVAWNKQTKQTSGYQIQVSTSSKFSKNVSSYILDRTTTSKSVRSLSSGKKYYVRVRTFKKKDNTRYYSSWSRVKSITV